MIVSRSLIVGFAFLGLDLLTYHSAKVVVPAMVVLIGLLYLKKLWRIKIFFIAGLIAFSFFVALLFVEPNLLGVARVNQNKTQDSFTVGVLTQRYLTHFSFDYLFNIGDSNPRHSIQTFGIAYKPELVFMGVGVFVLLCGIVDKRRKEFLLLGVWMLLAPVPASISAEVPHAGRAMFMTGSLEIISALGAATLVTLIINKWYRVVSALAIVVLLGVFVFGYLKDYYGEYATRYAIEFQYGMADVVSYVKDNPQYYKVYMTNIRQQPYIFFLFYLKTPLNEFLESVKYDTSGQKSYNTVARYDRFQFGGWDEIESFPNSEILYVVEPAKYTGLRYKDRFEVKKLVKYPNGADAFYLVSGRQ